MRLLSLLLAITLWLGASPVRANEEAELEARALLREGNRLVKERDYEGALKLYQAAYRRFPSPKLLVNIGTTLQLVERMAEAADTYERYLADPAAESQRRQEIERLLTELERKVGRLRITVVEPGARVLLDGRPVGESPQEIRVRADPGTHTVTAEKPGVPPVVATARVGAGEEQSVELRLLEVPAQTQAKRVVSPPPEASKAPAIPLLPTPGASDTRRRRPPAWSPWVTAGVAILGTGAGAYFVRGALDSDAGWDTRSSAATHANLSFAAAGVTALAAGTLWYWRHRASD